MENVIIELKVIKGGNGLTGMKCDSNNDELEIGKTLSRLISHVNHVADYASCEIYLHDNSNILQPKRLIGLVTVFDFTKPLASIIL